MRGWNEGVREWGGEGVGSGQKWDGEIDGVRG